MTVDADRAPSSERQRRDSEVPGNVAVGVFVNLARQMLPLGWQVRDEPLPKQRTSDRERPFAFPRIAAGSHIKQLDNWLERQNAKTRNIYSWRSGKLIRAATRDGMGGTSTSIALHVLRRCACLGDSSARQYRNAMAYHFARQLVSEAYVTLASELADPHVEQSGTGSSAVDDLIAYLLMTAHREGPVDPDEEKQTNEASRKTRSKKGTHLKRFPLTDYQRVLEALPSPASRATKTRRRTLAALLVIGRITGVRPIEAESVLCFDNQSNAGDENCGGYVRITNAKADVGGERGCGSHRYHHYSDPHDWTLMREQLMDAKCIIDTVRSGLTDQEWEDERDRCQRLLAATCKRSGLPAYTLYGLRHQFAADLKLAYRGRDERDVVLAALMGHASSRTANRHYARANRGSRRPYLPEPDRQNMDQVRKHDRSFIEDEPEQRREPTRKTKPDRG